MAKSKRAYYSCVIKEGYNYTRISTGSHLQSHTAKFCHLAIHRYLYRLTHRSVNDAAGWVYSPGGELEWSYGGGSGVELHIEGDFFIDGGGLPGKQYKVAQLHYHWGNPNALGSEHAINGRKYDAEMHLVTYDTNYTSLKEAKTHTDGVAVFAAMVQVGLKPNFDGSSFDEFISGIQSLGSKDGCILPPLWQRSKRLHKD
ncbi:carbonic anhydrase 2-like [Acanthaster planci]|uniref:Carbonic anhydrase n=1 Tax=Acanthaster planci TaxID=133434 RepID=A0A8B7ZQU5_ACAPL|nr:carbonic anhydrase 2-like [Acanthaster planci]